MPEQSPEHLEPGHRRVPAHHLELPHPRRLIWTASWNMAESVGLPFGAWIVVTELFGRNPGLLAGLGVVWLLIVIRKMLTGSVSALLWISALVLTLQTAVVIFTGNVWMYLLQFPLANLAMCVFFARTAPTRKPLVAQLAAEVVALKVTDHHPGLHRFYQGATWFWSALFLLLTLGLAVMMVTEPYKLFMLLSTAVTIALTALGAAVCAIWFRAVLRRWGLRVRFAQLFSGGYTPTPQAPTRCASRRRGRSAVSRQGQALRLSRRSLLLAGPRAWWQP